MSSSNPILNNNNIYEQSYSITEGPMTAAGTMNKLFILSLIMMAGAAAVYYQFSLQRIDFVNLISIIGIFVGLICAVAIAFKQSLTPYLAPVYAFSQGAVLSGISCFLESEFHGIVIQAVSHTFIVVFSVAILFRLGIIKATEKFKAVIFAATSAIFLFYLITFLISLFGINISYYYSSSNLSITINIAIALIAAFNLVIDFDFIEKGVNLPLPKTYEWYGAFGLLVTILWIYIEILRLLAKSKRR